LSKQTVRIRIEKDGKATALYQELVDLSCLGPAQVRRASHIECKEPLPRWALRQRHRLRHIRVGQFYADMRLSGGPVLGPFSHYSTAVTAELAWLRTRLGI